MKQIDVYVDNNITLFETYNKNIISRNLIDYLLDQTVRIKRKENINLIIHVTKETKGCSSLIQNRLKAEYQKNLRIHSIINIKQVTLLLLGLILLFISTLIKDTEVFHEAILIGAWVPIWEAVELELITDTKEKRKRIRLKKLMKAKIEEVLI